MRKHDDRFGINIIKYCKAHEVYIAQKMDSQTELEKLFIYHGRKIEWLQHERLVHLLVTILTSVLFLFLFGLELFFKYNILVLVLLCISAILLCAYLFHYFRLENTVQRWYKISDEIYYKLIRK